MKKFIRITAVVLAVMFAALAFTACSGGGNTDTEKTYLIVADNSFAPFDYLDEATGKYTGIDMDILAAIAEDQGFKYTVDNCGWNAALGNLSSKTADGMIAGMTITDERKETFDFSDAYFEDGQILFVKEGSEIATLEDLEGKKVAVKTGTMGASYVESIKDEYNFTVESFDGSDAVYAAVSEGNVDAGVEDYSVINFKIASADLPFATLGEKVNVGPYGFAVPKGMNAELVEMFNKGLANIKENGVYDDILAKYGM